jgi:hypothetical protein
MPTKLFDESVQKLPCEGGEFYFGTLQSKKVEMLKKQHTEIGYHVWPIKPNDFYKLFTILKGCSHQNMYSFFNNMSN